MSSASPSASHRKLTRRPGRKAPTLRPDPNTSGTAGVWVVNDTEGHYQSVYMGPGVITTVGPVCTTNRSGRNLR